MKTCCRLDHLEDILHRASNLENHMLLLICLPFKIDKHAQSSPFYC